MHTDRLGKKQQYLTTDNTSEAELAWGAVSNV